MANFLWGSAGQKMSPAQVAEQRKIAQALIAEGSDTSPVGHWTAALNRGLQGYLGGRQAYQAREAENAGRAGYEAKKASMANANTFGGADPVAAALSGGAGLGNYAVPAGGEAIREGLIARGLPEHVADGFMMNFQDESGLNPGINERNPIVPGSRGGFGLYQLTGPRRTAYEQFASQRGVDPSDVDAQLDWLMYELQGPEANAAQSIFAAGNAGEAGAAIVNNFLRPAAEHRQSRASRYLGGGSAPAQNSPTNIAALLADEWVPESERAVLQAQYDAALKQQDPMYQAQLEAARLANQKAAQPVVSDYDQRAAAADQFGLQGDARQAFILTGNIPGLGGAGVPADFQALKLRAEAAGLVEGSDEYKKFMANGGRITNQMPAAVAAVHERALRAGLVEDTPEYQEFMRTNGAYDAAKATAEGTAVGANLAALPEQIVMAEEAVAAVNDLINDPAVGSITGGIQGRLPDILLGEDQMRAKSRLDLVLGQSFLQARQWLKGQGAITETESAKAEQAMSRLQRAQGDADFIAAAKELQSIMNKGVERLRGKMEGRMTNDGAEATPPAETVTQPRRRYNPTTRSFE